MDLLSLKSLNEIEINEARFPYLFSLTMTMRDLVEIIQ